MRVFRRCVFRSNNLRINFGKDFWGDLKCMMSFLVSLYCFFSDGVQFVVDITEGSMELTSPRKADAIEGGCTYHYMGPDVTFCCDHKRTILSDTVPVTLFYCSFLPPERKQNSPSGI
jgi:hypothetical protein